MADFKTHITVSTTLGIAYGAVAFKHFELPAPTCILAGTLCSVSGMLPDLDSDSGVPLRESLAFGAACIPMLLMERLPAGWTREMIVLAGAAMYLVIRFGLGKLLKKFTVHRGMFHSIPAAAIAFLVAFLVCVTGDLTLRIYKACGVLAGFMSHLLLDEVWSVNVQGGIRLKSSFGTAVKFWGDSFRDNLACYGMLAVFAVLVLKDPVWTTVPDDLKYAQEIKNAHQIATRVDGAVEQRVQGSLPNGASNWLLGLTSSPINEAASSSSQRAEPQANPPPNSYANNYASPTSSPYPTYANPYAGAATIPPQPPMYSEPMYNAPAPYGAPPAYQPTQPYVPSQPFTPSPNYAPTHPYELPQSQQAQGYGNTPYVSPRY